MAKIEIESSISLTTIYKYLYTETDKNITDNLNNNSVWVYADQLVVLINISIRAYWNDPNNWSSKYGALIVMKRLFLLLFLLCFGEIFLVLKNKYIK